MSKAQPLNKALWKKAHDAADKAYKVHSAYKSGFIVKYYKDHGGKFSSAMPKERTDLHRWYKEQWVNQHGTSGYQHKNDVYRPSKRINKKTPATWRELNKRQITKASRAKSNTGRVKKFKV